MDFKVHDIVTVPLAGGAWARGKIVYLDDCAGPAGRCADIELVDARSPSPLVWAPVAELRHDAALGDRCNYTPARVCDCARVSECVLHFSDDLGGC